MALAAAAVLATGPGAASSTAATATTWTVRPGGTFTAAAGTTTLTDTTTGVFLTCTSSSMAGTLKSGSGLPGTSIGSITKAAYHCCGHICSPSLAPRGLPWHLNLTSYNAATGVSRGTISHLQLALSIPEFGCSAVVNGTSATTSDGVVTVTYANQTGKLKIHPAGGTLHWYHVNGCAGQVHNGDPATLSAAYALSPPQAITSP